MQLRLQPLENLRPRILVRHRPLFVVVLGIVLGAARREIVEIRKGFVRRVVFQCELTPGRLQGYRTARTLGVLLFGLRVRAPLRLRVGSEVPVARSRHRRSRLERSRSAKGSRGSPEPARPWAHRRTPGAWTAGSPIFPGARFADRERTSVEDLTIE